MSLLFLTLDFESKIRMFWVGFKLDRFFFSNSQCAPPISWNIKLEFSNDIRLFLYRNIYIFISEGVIFIPWSLSKFVKAHCPLKEGMGKYFNYAAYTYIYSTNIGK